MRHVEFEKFRQDVMAFPATGVCKDLSACHHGEGQSAEHLGDFNADPAWIFAGAQPVGRAGIEVVVFIDQIVGDLHQGAA